MLRHPLTKKFLQTGLFSGLRSFAELERRIEKLRADSEGATKKLKGDAFEVFAAAYLATQRSQMAKRIWPRMQSVPPTIARRLGWKPKDHGSDGLIETVAGDFRGYQAKFRTKRAALPWAEVSTFFGVTDRCDDRLLITNSTNVAEIAEQRSDFISVRGNDLDQLEAADFRAMLEWMRGAAPHRKKATPRPHQREALAAIRKAFKKEDRGTVVSACGTGKTFTALWAAEEIARRSVIVLVPSLALIRQTLRDWSKNTNWKSFDYICVCSDQTVSQEEDSLVLRPTELPFSVTTEVAKVRKFLRHPFQGVKVVFTTYQSAPIVGKAMGRGDAFDLGIFDEAHKTAGSEGKRNAFALSDKNLRIRKRLFLTATPRKYRLPSKESERGKDLEPVFSMDQPEVYGRHIHKLSFGKAAAAGIICDYKVVISVVTSSAAEQKQRRCGVVMVKGDLVKAAQVVNQLAIAQAVRKHKIGKVFSFHRSLASAASFVSEGSEGVQTHLGDFKTLHIEGKMSTALREGILREFQEAKRGIVSNVRCLTEGVDVPAVDMVAFMSPKRSKVDIVQAVGRAMRTSPETGKKLGYILVPLHVELKKNESLEDAVKRAGFDDVWQVLAAMQEQDEVLDEAIHQIQADRKLGKGFSDELFRQRVEIVGPPVALSALRKSVTTKCLERLSRPWDEYIKMLLAFKKKFGHLNVPPDARGPWRELAEWVKVVRARFRRGTLTPQRVEHLRQLGFQWRVAGQTLDSVDGLLTEQQFADYSGVSNLSLYRRKKIIEPIGFGISNAGVSPFYQKSQLGPFRKALGITLTSINGLLNEQEFKFACGLSSVGRYRQKGLLKPFGFAIVPGAGVAPYYHPKQVRALKKTLGVTLNSTKGLLNEYGFGCRFGLSNVGRYRRKGIIKPVGFAIAQSGLTPFYRPNQIVELRKKLGVTLMSTTGLLSEKQFGSTSGLTNVARYRKQGLIKPAGLGICGGARGVGLFYHPRQVDELRRKLGITLSSTKGLLNEKQFIQYSGLSRIADYREKGLIKPVGHAITSGAGVSPYYRRDQITELYKKLGITLRSVSGLLSEANFSRVCGISRISNYRKKGLIKPVGYAMAGKTISAYYRRDQAKELKKAIGITLESTQGLLSEQQFRRKSGLFQVANYRKKGLLKPVGYALNAAGVRPYYHPKQIPELKRALGITLESTKGLLSEAQIARLPGLSRAADYRRKGLIKPAGYAVTGPVVGPYYHPIQIALLRRQLAKTPLSSYLTTSGRRAKTQTRQ